MTNKTKMILTAIGLAAVIVPAVLLWFFTSQKSLPATSNVPAGNRTINKGTIEKEVKSTQNSTQAAPSQAPVVVKPTPIASSSPAKTTESTPSSQ